MYTGVHLERFACYCVLLLITGACVTVMLNFDNFRANAQLNICRRVEVMCLDSTMRCVTEVRCSRTWYQLSYLINAMYKLWLIIWCVR